MCALDCRDLMHLVLKFQPRRIRQSKSLKDSVQRVFMLTILDKRLSDQAVESASYIHEQNADTVSLSFPISVVQIEAHRRLHGRKYRHSTNLQPTPKGLNKLGPVSRMQGFAHRTAHEEGAIA